MQIKRLRLTGFKSFVDPADLRIEPGLTGVVGPNGCGKSNLLEALRWTMGEASAKSLRGAGMDDVIFAGTATRPARDFAEVSLLAELPGADGPEEREIVRRIERGAGSAYRIDGVDVRARDVALLFADAATGAHSPALVSQNRIGAVIAAKPGDRRAMLEEAAGISGLHVRRRDAEARLRATEANLLRLDEVIADQEARAVALRRQARSAERYRALSAQIRIAEARMIFARWREADAAAGAARRDAVAGEAAVASATTAYQDAGAARETAAAALAGVRADALAARDRASDAGHRLATLEAERAELSRRIAALADSRRRIADDRAREGTLAADASAAIARLSTEIAALDATVRAATLALPAHDAAVADAERAARDAEVALAKALARQAAETADARVAIAARDAAVRQAARARRDADEVNAAFAALGDSAPIEAERRTAEDAHRAALAEATAARAAIDAADGATAAATAEHDAAVSAVASARAALAALDAEAAALARATRPDDRARQIDALGVTPGYEHALAAGLGDDGEAPAEAWTGSPPGDDDPPPLPGTIPLSGVVTGPATLDRRLAQILVAEADEGQRLAPGQRLVTRTGALRRWDGFVAEGNGAAAAERLVRRNRLAAIAAARPDTTAELTRAEADRTAAETRASDVRRAGGEARARLGQAETAARRAAQFADRATARIERMAGQRDDLAARAARTAAEVRETADEVARAEAVVAALPDSAVGAARAASLSRAAETARAAVASAAGARTVATRAAQAERERLAAAQADVRNWRARAGDAASRIADMDRRDAALAREAAGLADHPARVDIAITRAEADRDAASAAAAALAAAEAEAEAALRGTEAEARAAAETLATAREARAGAAARLDNLEARRIEIGRTAGERFECPAPVLPERIGFAIDQVSVAPDEATAHDRLVIERERIGPVNLVAESELAEIAAAATANAAERDELSQAVARLRGSIGTLNREGRERLRAAFDAVDGHFRRLFTTLFDGGQAHLELIDSDDPLEAGLEIMAQPPGKRLQSLTLLSGGEQALTAIALIFGLFLTNPAPICVLDEVDAPLDDANIERFCDLLDAMTRETRTRYLIVTHNAVTMSRMHRLFGVTMIEKGVSRLVSVDLGTAAALAAE